MRLWFFYFALSVIFPICALGAGVGVDDDEMITSVVVYGFTPAKVLFSSERSGRRQKVEDFIVGLTLRSKRVRMLQLLEKELDERPLSDILKYVEYHKLDAVARILKENISDGADVMLSVMHKHYEKGGKSDLLQYMIGLFGLEANEDSQSTSSVIDEFEKDVARIDDSDVQSQMVEITLLAIIARLKRICEEYSIKPKLACQKGLVNKTLDFFTNRFSKVLITTGSALCAIGANEFIMGCLSVAATNYTLHYRGHDATHNEYEDRCEYFACDDAVKKVEVTGIDGLPGCMVVRSPGAYTSADMCVVAVDKDNHANAFMRDRNYELFPVKAGRGEKPPYQVYLRASNDEVYNAAVERDRARELQDAVLGCAIVLGGSGLIAAGCALYYYRKSAALERRLVDFGIDESGGGLTSLVADLSDEESVAKDQRSAISMTEFCDDTKSSGLYPDLQNVLVEASAPPLLSLDVNDGIALESLRGSQGATNDTCLLSETMNALNISKESQECLAPCSGLDGAQVVTEGRIPMSCENEESSVGSSAPSLDSGNAEIKESDAGSLSVAGEAGPESPSAAVDSSSLNGDVSFADRLSGGLLR
ncbi:MAG: hypothetical protein QS748_09800 [Candidatus Endonucleobacter bathymodioli]|uniref:Uncharacterized protein n=1 Tax=Candidatus Endonucleibacter bathymodioli TaxID=539814 RepID=A0AA90STE9_9GAMM|nr:hypothetical protein [Candidatus Endonucleobacter bathymodioli]